MLRSANRLWLLLLVIGTPAVAEEFSTDVIRGSEIVRVIWNESGEFREETLREDPTPKPPPGEVQAHAPRAVGDYGPTIQIIVETADSTFPVGYVVVWPQDQHHRRSYFLPDRHRRSPGGFGLAPRPWRSGHARTMQTQRLGFGR